MTRPISTPTPAPSPNLRRFCQLSDAAKAEMMGHRGPHRGHRGRDSHSTPRRGLADHHRVTPDNLTPRSTPTVSPRTTPGRTLDSNAWGTPDITPGDTPVEHRTPDGSLEHSLDSINRKVPVGDRSKSPEIVAAPGTPSKVRDSGTGGPHTPKKTPSKLSLNKIKSDKKSKACKNNSLGCFGCISRKGECSFIGPVL